MSEVVVNPYQFAVASEEFCNNLFDDDQSLTSNSRAGQQWKAGSDMVGKTLKTITVPMKYDSDGGSTDNIYGRVYDSDGSTLLSTIGSVSNSTLTTSFANVTFTGTATQTIEAGDWICVEVSEDVRTTQTTRYRYYYTSNPFSNTEYGYYTVSSSSWSANAAHCMTYCVAT